MVPGEERMRYFSTNFTVKMLGTRYISSVCYPLDNIIEPTIVKLVEKGEARMYPEKVRFVNGKPLPIKKSKQAAVSDNEIGTGKKGKRGKRDFD